LAISFYWTYPHKGGWWGAGARSAKREPVGADRRFVTFIFLLFIKRGAPKFILFIFRKQKKTIGRAQNKREQNKSVSYFYY
jgi:hypothetical protein